MSKIDILYDVWDKDSVPFKVCVNRDILPYLIDNSSNGRAKIKEKNTTDGDIIKYCVFTDKYLYGIDVPPETVGCTDRQSTDKNQISTL